MTSKTLTVASEPKQRWQHHTVIQSSSLSPPSQRMVAVQASIDGGEPWHDILPVVAIESRIERCYSRQVPAGRDEITPAPTHRELTASGWHLVDRQRVIEPLILDPYSGEIAPLSSDHWQASNSTDPRLAVCTWPPEDDEQRLADLVQRLTEDIRRRLKAKVPA